jgi:Lar family restriction alleviation protein
MDTCVVCGGYVVEGRQVCKECMSATDMSNVSDRTIIHIRMSETLLPCPFCGGEALMRERYINGIANRKHYRRECRHCKATFAHWFRSIKKANEAWNRRANLGRIIGCNGLVRASEVERRCR